MELLIYRIRNQDVICESAPRPKDIQNLTDVASNENDEYTRIDRQDHGLKSTLHSQWLLSTMVSVLLIVNGLSGSIDRPLVSPP